MSPQPDMRHSSPDVAGPCKGPEVVESRGVETLTDRPSETGATDPSVAGDAACQAPRQERSLADRIIEETGEFLGWDHAVAAMIEGQEEEVALDHNRMLDRLMRLRSLAQAERDNRRSRFSGFPGANAPQA